MVFGLQQRLCHLRIERIDITLGGESVKHSDSFKYIGVILDSSLSLNQHINYLKKKVSKTLGMFSRALLPLSIEAVNRLFKSMFFQFWTIAVLFFIRTIDDISENSQVHE